jgi:hypothetical protein
MLIPFGVVFGMGLVFMVMIHRQARRTAARRLPEATHRLPEGLWPVPTHRRSLLENHGRWLAVRSTNAAAIQTALALDNPAPCSWADMLSRLEEGKLFISPPVADWTLIVGQGLPDPGDEVDECFHFLRHLSSKLGQVQFFSVNRALGHHAWAHAVDGRILRAYAWCGETVWNQGDVTSAELGLGMSCLGYGQTADSGGFGAASPEEINSDRIFALAARWSVDPAVIEAAVLDGTTGITGDLSRSRSH